MVAKPMEKKSPKGRQRGPMPAKQRQEMATRRQESHVVKNYLEALEAGAGSSKVQLARISRQIERINGEMPGAGVLRRLELTERRSQLAHKRKILEGHGDADSLEAKFVKVAGSYSKRRGIGYESWRELGVPARVLREAGVSRRTAE